MTRTQKDFLATMTTAQATALMAKFENDPYIAYQKSINAFSAFAIAFEMVNPDSHLRLENMASGISISTYYMGE